MLQESPSMLVVALESGVIYRVTSVLLAAFGC